MLIGVVSDTHGLLRPEVAPALVGVEYILHLGDVGNDSILAELERIAPVHAVRGNIDLSGTPAKLPETDVLLFECHYVYLLHNIGALSLDPAAAKFSAVLYGHSHQPHIGHQKGVLYFNPGSCGPRRFNLPVTLGLLEITPAAVEPRIIPLLD
ncbi:MAG: metallophosphoesterase family protein [Acidobacteriota bacterium]|nr:metallophosphoesterase family protein [Acidobacteriota bacterium]